MKEVAILLTTYQSDKYLARLLDSIINQTIQNWDLYIRDDRSTDRTHEIIYDYCSKYDNIHFIDDKEKRGAKDGFMWLLSQVNAKYYMFCDHDDFWLPQKVEETYNTLKKYENSNLPVVVHTDLVITDSNLKTISPSFWEYTHLNRIVDNNAYLKYCNFVTGCAMGFNNAAKEVSIVENYKYAIMHDSWVALCTLKNKGIIIPVHNSLIYYCQHNSNTLGAVKYKMTLLVILRKFKKIIKDNKKWYRMVNMLINVSLPEFIYWKLLILLKKW